MGLVLLVPNINSVTLALNHVRNLTESRVGLRNHVGIVDSEAKDSDEGVAVATGGLVKAGPRTAYDQVQEVTTILL